MRALRLSVAVAVLGGLIAAGALSAANAATSEPRWVKHVHNYKGGISNGVRAMLAAAESGQTASPASASSSTATGPSSPSTPGSAYAQYGDRQVNEDTTKPPLPQNETSVAVSTLHPNQAVGGANDYETGGMQIYHTTDYGQSWTTNAITPQFFPTRAFCNGGDPWFAYSLRESLQNHADTQGAGRDVFYATQLCFFRDRAESEIHLYKTVDGGDHWTPSRYASYVVTNTPHGSLQTNVAVFYDKEVLTVDNNPTSPYFGRIYVAYIKFHLLPSGFSDFCPVQLAWTNVVNTENPRDFTNWTHKKVVPDKPGDDGIGESANQGTSIDIGWDGSVNITYNLEDCNTALDRGIRFQKSTTGGQSFLANRVVVTNPGTKYRDNPDASDLIPTTSFRTPNMTSLDSNKATGTLVVLYINYINKAQTNGDINASRSTDGGLHWSDPYPVSVGPNGINPASNDQFFPAVDSTESGDLVAIWFDRRLDTGPDTDYPWQSQPDPANHDIETFQGESTDDGLTWSNFRLSSGHWNPDYGFFTFPGVFIGDYNGLAATDVAAYPLWTDGRNNSYHPDPLVPPIGETDVFTNPEID